MTTTKEPKAQSHSMSFRFVAAITGFCAAGFLLAACAAKPPTPIWKMDAHGASERAVIAYFEGRQRTEEAEFALARSEIARTGDATQMARLELLRCAAQLASLDVQTCAAFAPLAEDATAAERAYVRYLEGEALSATDIALLPESQQASAGSTSANVEDPVRAQSDPLSELVAAGALFVRGRASPALVQLAVDTSSAQGWSRPLLAWLGIQERMATKAGADEEAQRIRRRIRIVTQKTAGG